MVVHDPRALSVRRSRLGRVLRAAALLAFGAMPAACAGAAAGPDAPLVMSRVKDAVDLDPAHATDGLSLNVTSEVMENLVTFRTGSFDIAPAIATAWHADDGGRRWTFTLRPHARFADGTPLDAAAVKFNFDRWRLPDDPQRGNFDYSYYADMFGGFPGVIADVQAPSPRTVVFRLTQPFGPFLRDIAMPSFAIGSPAAIAADPRGFELRPVGSGPYAVAEWIRDDHITLQANPRYDGPLPKPHIATVVIRDIPDTATALLSIIKGDVQWMDQPQTDDVALLARNPHVRVVNQPSNNLAYLALNVERPPFGSLLVRRAVASALDTSAIARGLYAPGTVAADNWTPPGMLGADPQVHAYARDIPRAKALLAQAGFAHGFSTTLYYPTAPRPYMPDPQRLAETLQSQLKDAGIAVTLEPLEFGVFLSKVRNGEHPMCLIGWSGDNGDPDDFLYPLLDQDSAHKGTAQNYSFWRDPRFHALMLAGQRNVDERKRAAIYRAANAMVHDEVPAVPIVHTVVPVALRTSIAGFVPSPDTRYHFELIYRTEPRP